MSFLLLFLIFCTAPLSLKAQYEHRLYRRLTVFPIADANLTNAEEAWWQMRDILTKDQRFMVAGKRLMINRGVFFPKRELSPGDTIILAKILEAHALFVPMVNERSLILRVYDGESGYLFWEASENFQAALPINEQIIKVASQLALQFLQELPYHGFQVIDESIGKAVYDVGSEMRTQIFIGVNPRIAVGDRVQWIKLRSNGGKVFLGRDTQVEVIAEGLIHSLAGDRAVVTLQGLTKPEDLTENSLIRLPKEIQFQREQKKGEERTSNLSSEYLSSQLRKPYEFKKDHDEATTSLAWIANLVAFILLAF